MMKDDFPGCFPPGKAVYGYFTALASTRLMSADSPQAES
ncbi:hypothetical protein RCAP_rcc01069 [Rhodobacter capsulatus SB 1003]|uniref:Uncharacterized protein n=1 Tax=Rhodobacter capsulatus (strain ATCC BAA-309 / NBRC 16581 / SB1003) TaxID=272942 RepID=D5AR23_RHOCB|nr:hypothetical protein RCAP_rcc01069 [Rhodobacter capsulatus SB 1003]